MGDSRRTPRMHARRPLAVYSLRRYTASKLEPSPRLLRSFPSPPRGVCTREGGVQACVRVCVYTFMRMHEQ